MPITIQRESQELRLLPVSATLDTGAPADISGDAVYVAITPAGTRPDVGGWVACAWSTDVPGSVVVPLNLPNGFTVTTQGRYIVWVKVVDSPENPVVRSAEPLYVA